MASRDKRRKARPTAERPGGRGPTSKERMEAGYARAEQRNATLRAGLEPLAPGERPPALLISIGLCALLVLRGLWLLVAGSDDTKPGFIVVLTAVIAYAGYGMWRQQATATLGWLVFLLVAIIGAFAGLVTFSNVAGLLLSLTVLVLASWLFYKLIRVLGRMQAPPR